MSNNLDNVDTLELLDRYNNIIKKYCEISIELAPKLEKFGKYREELQLLSAEFKKRGYVPEEQDSLKKLIEKELETRNIKQNG